MDVLKQAWSRLLEFPDLGWAAAVLVALCCGVIFGRRRTRRAFTGTVVPRSDADMAAQVLRDMKASVARLEAENAGFQHFFQLLPDFTREINNRMDRRAVGPFLLKVTEQLFAPSQVLVFSLDERVNTLVLTNQRGLAEDVKMGFHVKVGEGRIGYVAEHKVPMDTGDFIREMRQTGVSLEVSGHLRFRTELCAPMVHEGRVMGVISVGGISRHYKYEKTILSLIADLGSIALHNYALFSQVQENANLDGLTRLYNKRFFMERLAHEMTRADKAHHPVSLFLFDLDNFKQYNDREGHQAGDEVLRVTGRLLREMVRPDDIAARYGGEEFVVILPHTPKDGALTFAERILRRVAGHDYPNAARQPLGCVSLSGGVATRPDDGSDGQALIAAADAALYRAKGKGRNRVEAAASSLMSESEEEHLAGTGQG